MRMHVRACTYAYARVCTCAHAEPQAEQRGASHLCTRMHVVVHVLHVHACICGASHRGDDEHCEDGALEGAQVVLAPSELDLRQARSLGVDEDQKVWAGGARARLWDLIIEGLPRPKLDDGIAEGDERDRGGGDAAAPPAAHLQMICIYMWVY